MTVYETSRLAALRAELDASFRNVCRMEFVEKPQTSSERLRKFEVTGLEVLR